MKKSTLFKFIVYFIAFGLPILSMANCLGWNEGTGQVTSCFIDTPFLRSVSNFFYNVINVSVFIGLLPVILYAIIIILPTRCIAKYLK